MSIQNIEKTIEFQFIQELTEAKNFVASICQLDLSTVLSLHFEEPHKNITSSEWCDVFSTWKSIKARWDRQGILINSILKITHDLLKPWQVATILNFTRNPEEALSILNRQQVESSNLEDYEFCCGTLAQSLIILTRYDEALEFVYKGKDVNPNSQYLSRLIADIQFLLGNVNISDQMYQSMVSFSSIKQDASIFDLFHSIFSHTRGRFPSPILALQIIDSIQDTNQKEELWGLGEFEFYFSPQFRMKHAYYLASTSRLDRCFAKLYVLVKEMPWLKEASINLSQLFKHFDPSSSKIDPAFQRKLQSHIEKNNWNISDLSPFSISVARS
jgi:tetratricopeptide (TPR) repeat protein